MEGGSLHEFLHRRTASSSPLTAEAQHSIALDVARGLTYLHSLGWMHRDVKPSNVLLDSATPPRAKVGDFGLSTRIGFEAHVATVGTHCYMAPEVYFQAYSTRADVYAFGILLWELIYAERPFQSYREQGKVALVVAITMHDRRPELRSGAVAVPCGYARVASACWATDVGKRPGMAQVVVWLQCLEGSPIGPPQMEVRIEEACESTFHSAAAPAMNQSLMSVPGFEHHTSKLGAAEFAEDHFIGVGG